MGLSVGAFAGTFEYIGSSDIQASYRQAETEAWEQQRGLWSEPDPIPPWEYRHAAKQTTH
jgi:endonuclease YncB( thermonuclease family)